jgi:hypothetical protein
MGIRCAPPRPQYLSHSETTKQEFTHRSDLRRFLHEMFPFEFYNVAK